MARRRFYPLRFHRWQKMFFPRSRTRAYHAWRAAQPVEPDNRDKIADYFHRWMEEGRKNYALRERIVNLKATILQLEAELDDLRQWLRP
jgi:hypothetical protein